MDAAGGQRDQVSGGAVDDLDRDVVAVDQVPEPVGDLLQHRALVEGGQDRLRRAQQLPLSRQLALERGRLLLEPCGRVRVGHRLGRERGVDHEQPQVVLGELAEAELREHEHAEAGALVDHRRQEHGLVDVGLGSRDRDRPRVVRRVVDQLRHAVLGDPSGHALAHRDPQVLDGLVGVHRAVAEHRDRHQVVAMGPVDADVVVVDELAELGGDRVADLADVGEPRQPRPQALDRLELGRPGRHPAERARRPDRDRRVAREGLGTVEVDLAPAMGSIVGEVQHPVHLVTVDQRRGEQRVHAFLHGRRPDRRPRARRVRAHEDRRATRRQLSKAGALRLDLPRRVEERVGEAGAAGRGHAALVVAQHDRDAVRPEQHAGVVAEVAHDVADVQPRGQVRGDAGAALPRAGAGCSPARWR